ncbi:MAG: tRNA (guanosine(46)-N7)-methyltransferase TrmB [Pseudomonadota bacterium]
MTEQKHQSLRTFGRLGGRKLSQRQQNLVDNALPKLRVPLPGTGQLDPARLFDAPKAVWFEIGFGGGEHPVGQAIAHPNVGIIASEVFIEGLAKCLGQIEDQAVGNLRLWDDDARNLLDRLETASLDRIFILFPDPWPKLRHHKRRLIQPAFLDLAAQVLKPGGHLRFATDVRHYADEALTRFVSHNAFEWTANCAFDWRMAPADHVPTRYETKNIGDIQPVWFDFARL